MKEIDMFFRGSDDLDKKGEVFSNYYNDFILIMSFNSLFVFLTNGMILHKDAVLSEWGLIFSVVGAVLFAIVAIGIRYGNLLLITVGFMNIFSALLLENFILVIPNFSSYVCMNFLAVVIIYFIGCLVANIFLIFVIPAWRFTHPIDVFIQNIRDMG